MPAYIRRPHDELLRAILDPAVAASRLVVVRGGSSTGKTRAAYDAVVGQLADCQLDYPLDPSWIHCVSLSWRWRDRAVPGRARPDRGAAEAVPGGGAGEDDFSALDDPDFPALLPIRSSEIIVAGCEAHVCVLQTVLGLMAEGHRVVVVADAIGSRDPADKALAIDRARQDGAEIVTSEMVLFEWLRDCAAPQVPRGTAAY